MSWNRFSSVEVALAPKRVYVIAACVCVCHSVTPTSRFEAATFLAGWND